ncbi:MAG: YraN family protein [Patescibacteria group bacterium]
MKNYRQKLGATGERIAAEYLKEKGYLIKDRNFRVREGEIDLIAEKNYEYIFIEVKTRTSPKFGPPEESVNLKKQEKYAAVIEKYLEKNRLKNALWHCEIISLMIDKKQNTICLRHFKKI